MLKNFPPDRKQGRENKMNCTVECMFALSLLLKIGLDPFSLSFKFWSPFKKTKTQRCTGFNLETLKNKVRLFLLSLNLLSICPNWVVVDELIAFLVFGKTQFSWEQYIVSVKEEKCKLLEKVWKQIQCSKEKFLNLKWLVKDW